MKNFIPAILLSLFIGLVVSFTVHTFILHPLFTLNSMTEIEQSLE